MKNPTVLLIMDGFGISDETYGNAIKAAFTPNLDKLFRENPYTELEASGSAVGLPENQMGNSEVGHTNIGAGRVVYQDLSRITKSIQDGDFFENFALNNAINNTLTKQSSLHLIGLLSDGGVHSHIDHLYALLKLAKSKGLKEVFIHAFLDGRDVSPTSGVNYIEQCLTKIKEIGIGQIATITGRYYAMDRDNHYDRVEKAYNAMVLADGYHAIDPIDAIKKSYDNNITDEFIEPIILQNTRSIANNDSVIFFNFRPDRAREITRAFTDKDFNGFSRAAGRFPLKFICMTEYDSTIEDVEIAFKPEIIKNTLGEHISHCGLSQLRIAETEKYAHVTFFLNAGVEQPYKAEKRILIPSPKVPTYDLQPEMSQPELTAKTIEAIKSKEYDLIVLNFANCDMVGHTGIYSATIKAVEAVDRGVGAITQAVIETNGVLIITADHGNAEKMLEKDGSIFTAHTNNKVPFCVVNYPCKLLDGGKLSNISPSILDIIGLSIPTEQSNSLILKMEN